MITCCNVSNEYGQRKPNPNGGWMDGMVDETNLTKNVPSDFPLKRRSEFIRVQFGNNQFNNLKRFCKQRSHIQSRPLHRIGFVVVDDIIRRPLSIPTPPFDICRLIDCGGKGGGKGGGDILAADVNSGNNDVDDDPDNKNVDGYIELRYDDDND
ncbi:hypothetical protein DERP_007931 [Dermatophagoides pteronyssinus]|uniref:Uncharacterized protein n=1 Tax=Dermatophagoides pteronyssinus TaxID=6956 RepID=A0ABQ8IT12_DERPT|nr:hypothetical protein DERP_007931 [Dermatophagoides pteronyssinus]